METVVDTPALRDAQPDAAPNKDAKTRASSRRTSRLALFDDLFEALRAPGFWLYGAWMDASLRYRSQALGAFWMVAGTLVFVLLLGTLFSQVLNNQDQSYYAHLATGYVFFIFAQQSLIRSCRVFSGNRNMIQNGYVKYADYVLRMFGSQFVNLLYNLCVVVGAVVLAQIELTTAVFALVLTVPLFFLAVLGACFVMSVVGARYADVGELARTVLRLAFLLTPIIWVASATSGKGAYLKPFLFANPFYYLVEIIRAPLVYGHVPWFEIGVVAAAIPVIWLIAALTYARARPYIPLWI
jgi:homopolymeric O-antigen transport system permease protein